jgi:hypothetical protein
LNREYPKPIEDIPIAPDDLDRTLGAGGELAGP